MHTQGIIVARRFAQYEDKPGLLYHYPKAKYQKVVERLLGSTVLVYEPRRGGISPESKHGGRSAFVAVCELGSITADPRDTGKAYVTTENYREFPNPVGIRETPLSGQSLERAVQEVSGEVVTEILKQGFATLLMPNREPTEEALVDLAVAIPPDREIRQMVTERPVRDASFRYIVVEKAYNGICALTGLRLTNGFGRAETEAAHIMPVACGGPDSVRNGIALSKTMHWAFDRGLVSISNEGKILLAPSKVTDQLSALVGSDRNARLPSDVNSQPHPAFLEWHRRNVFKANATHA